MPTEQTTKRRPHGTGRLEERIARDGTVTFYGVFRVGDRQVRRRLGRRSTVGTTDGLSKTDANRALQRLIEAERGLGRASERLTFTDAAERYLEHLEHTMHRKPTTLIDYRLTLRRHLEPAFGDKALDRISVDEVQRYIARKATERTFRGHEERDGKKPSGPPLSSKTIRNHVTLLGGIFRYAVKRQWAPRNPVESVDLPPASGADPDLRFLDLEELEAVLRVLDADESTISDTDHAIVLTAALAGLRQGELVALRWRDIDWPAAQIRVRRSYGLKAFSTPKSRRGSRAVPMPDRLAGVLDRHHKTSSYRTDDDLVFANPETGHPLDASALRRRFTAALVAAKVRRVRFHDLRHTYGTRMAAVGTPIRTLMQWMGHANMQTTLIYADYAPDPMQGAQLAARAFGGPLTGTKEGEAAVSLARNEV